MASVTEDWRGDYLGRKKTALFLHRLVLQRFESSKGKDAGALCFALDGDWGTGKTFFAQHWAEDIRSSQHPVVVFDAWKNDLTQDPLLGFISALKLELKSWAAQVPRAEAAGAAIRKELGTVMKKAGRAIMPVSTVLLRGALKKVSGVSMDEIVDAFAGDDNADDKDHGRMDGEQQGSSAKGVASEAIDALFSVSIDEHLKRMHAVDDLKRGIEQLLKRLNEHAKANLPMFVLIDELDRCRPDYAIALLEGVKHLFDARGVCFIVSTNIPQLCESLKAVYGGGFDAYRYLKRFFAFEFPLPAPDLRQFVRLLTADSFLTNYTRVISGLPDWARTKPSKDRIEEAFVWVAEGFQIDLRSQKQVFRIAEAAAGSLSPQASLHALFLFSLAALRHADPKLFDDVMRKPEGFDTKKNLGLISPEATRLVRPGRSRGAFGEEPRSERRTSLLDVFREYLNWSSRDLKEIYDQSDGAAQSDYPKSLQRTLVEELGGSFTRTKEYPPSIQQYFQLVRQAGQRLEPDDG